LAGVSSEGGAARRYISLAVCSELTRLRSRSAGCGRRVARAPCCSDALARGGPVVGREGLMPAPRRTGEALFAVPIGTNPLKREELLLTGLRCVLWPQKLSVRDRDGAASLTKGFPVIQKHGRDRDTGAGGLDPAACRARPVPAPVCKAWPEGQDAVVVAGMLWVEPRSENRGVHRWPPNGSGKARQVQRRTRQRTSGQACRLSEHPRCGKHGTPVSAKSAVLSTEGVPAGVRRAVRGPGSRTPASASAGTRVWGGGKNNPAPRVGGGPGGGGGSLNGARHNHGGESQELFRGCAGATRFL